MNRETLLKFSLIWPHAVLALVFIMFIMTGEMPEAHNLLMLLLPSIVGIIVCTTKF